LEKRLRETEAFFVFAGKAYRVMKPFPAEPRRNPKPAAASLSGPEPVRLVCAALILASLAALFRIVSIW